MTPSGDIDGAEKVLPVTFDTEGRTVAKKKAAKKAAKKKVAKKATKKAAKKK